MRDRGRILVGLVIFLVLVTVPVWYSLLSGQVPAPPDLELPPQGGQCVADTEYMRTDHMLLLNEWRDDVVRSNDRIHTTDDGRRYYKSLTSTCVSCHDKQGFCNKCHDYVGVTPYCWDCHIDPNGVQ